MELEVNSADYVTGRQSTLSAHSAAATTTTTTTIIIIIIIRQSLQ